MIRFFSLIFVFAFSVDASVDFSTFKKVPGIFDNLAEFCYLLSKIDAKKYQVTYSSIGLCLNLSYRGFCEANELYNPPEGSSKCLKEWKTDFQRNFGHFLTTFMKKASPGIENLMIRCYSPEQMELSLNVDKNGNIGYMEQTKPQEPADATGLPPSPAKSIAIKGSREGALSPPIKTVDQFVGTLRAIVEDKSKQSVPTSSTQPLSLLREESAQTTTTSSSSTAKSEKETSIVPISSTQPLSPAITVEEMFAVTYQEIRSNTLKDALDILRYNINSEVIRDLKKAQSSVDIDPRAPEFFNRLVLNIPISIKQTKNLDQFPKSEKNSVAEIMLTNSCIRRFNLMIAGKHNFAVIRKSPSELAMKPNKKNIEKILKTLTFEIDDTIDMAQIASALSRRQSDDFLHFAGNRDFSFTKKISSISIIGVKTINLIVYHSIENQSDDLSGVFDIARDVITPKLIEFHISRLRSKHDIELQFFVHVRNLEFRAISSTNLLASMPVLSEIMNQNKKILALSIIGWDVFIDQGACLVKYNATRTSSPGMSIEYGQNNQIVEDLSTGDELKLRTAVAKLGESTGACQY